MRPLTLILAMLWLIAGCASSAPAPKGGAEPRKSGAEPTIRVLVLSSSGSATVASTGSVKVMGSGGAALLSGSRGGTISLQRTRRGIQVRLDASGDTAESTGDVVID